MEDHQRGAKAGCSGTTDNLMIDHTVTLDFHRHKRSLSVARIDVHRAFDAVDRLWVKKVMVVHKFPTWICEVIRRLCDSWKRETSQTIHFNRGLRHWGAPSCPHLFTLCLNQVARKLCSAEGYRLSKSIAANMTSLLYMDDLTIKAVSEVKLNGVLKMARGVMNDNGRRYATCQERVYRPVTPNKVIWAIWTSNPSRRIPSIVSKECLSSFVKRISWHWNARRAPI